MINAGDSTAVVKAQISDALALAGVAAPTSWSDAHNKLNSVAAHFERDGLTDEMIGSVARARINALFGGPSFAPDGSDLYLDFKSDKAWGRGSAVAGVDAYTSLVRSTSALMLGSAGYQSFAAGELARIDGVGAQVAPARTNKSANRNANPVDLAGISSSGGITLSVVDDVAELAAAGLSGIATSGKVYRAEKNASAGSWVGIAGVTGNTNIHAVSVVLRVVGAGYALLGFSGDGGGSEQFNAAAYGSYKRATYVSAPSSSKTFELNVIGTGTVVYFILNQLEEGSFASPPIITTGGAATRAGDLLTADLTGKLAYGVAGFVKVDVKQPSVASTFPQVLAFNDGGGSNRISAYHSSGNLALLVDTGGVRQATLSLGPWQQGEQTIAFAVGENFVMARRVGGAAPAADTTAALPSISTVSLGGSGYTTLENTFQINQKLALFYASPTNPINQAFFDEVYAKAVAA